MMIILSTTIILLTIMTGIEEEGDAGVEGWVEGGGGAQALRQEDQQILWYQLRQHHHCRRVYPVP